MHTSNWILSLEFFERQLNDYVDANCSRKGDEIERFAPIVEGHTLYDSAIHICHLAGWKTLPTGGRFRPCLNFRRLVAATGGMSESQLIANGLSAGIVGDGEAIGEAIESLLNWVDYELEQNDRNINELSPVENTTESEFETRVKSFYGSFAIKDFQNFISADEVNESTQEESQSPDDCLTSNQLAIFQALQTRKHGASFDTIATTPGAFRDGQPTDSAIQKALKRLRDRLLAAGYNIEIKSSTRRAKLERL